MAHFCVKLIGAPNYHIYSSPLLGKFLLSERKEIPHRKADFSHTERFGGKNWADIDSVSTHKSVKLM